MSRPQPAAGQDETLADVVRQARIEAGFNSVRSFAGKVGEELGIAAETARSELTAIENGRRGVSDRYARAISHLTGVPLTRLRAARPPAEAEQIADALADLADAVTAQSHKLDRVLRLLQQHPDDDSSSEYLQQQP